MTRLRASALAVPLVLALAGCGSDPAPEPPFSFVPVAGMACADGSATGIGLARGSADRVLLFLNGGGACWGSGACDPRQAGPFGPTELALGQALLVPGSILDRDLSGNPFAGFTMVFVPYCTGDVHAGDRDTIHGGVLWRHRGRRNLEAAIAWVASSLPRPSHVVVAGTSAGGFGTLLAYDLVRAEWPPDGASTVTAALVDDSGPTFVTDAIPSSLRAAWWDSWNLSSTVDPTCPGCRDDLSQIWTTRAATYPNDRFVLLSTTADETMRNFFGVMTGGDFSAALDELTGTIDATGNGAVFRTPGTDHGLLAAPARYAAQGTSLLQWLAPLAAPSGQVVSRGP